MCECQAVTLYHSDLKLEIQFGNCRDKTGLVLHTGIFYQNYFHSTIHPARGLSKQSKIHYKFEFVLLIHRILKLVFKELYHLAAILQHYVRRLIFMKHFFSLLIFKKKRPILLHF